MTTIVDNYKCTGSPGPTWNGSSSYFVMDYYNNNNNKDATSPSTNIIMMNKRVRKVSVDEDPFLGNIMTEGASPLSRCSSVHNIMSVSLEASFLSTASSFREDKLSNLSPMEVDQDIMDYKENINDNDNSYQQEKALLITPPPGIVRTACNTRSSSFHPKRSTPSDTCSTHTPNNIINGSTHSEHGEHEVVMVETEEAGGSSRNYFNVLICPVDPPTFKGVRFRTPIVTETRVRPRYRKKEVKKCFYSSRDIEE
eukprot:scaffold754_cov55-Attheya_sp.AAC.4